MENSSLGAKLAKFDRQLNPNLAHLGATWAILAPTWLQEASKWSSTGGLDRICGHLGAKKAPRAQPPKNGDHFPANLSKNIIFHSNYEPHGILHRIFRIFSDPAETEHPVQNRPWVPHAGGQDDGSLHKLPQINLLNKLRQQQNRWEYQSMVQHAMNLILASIHIIVFEPISQVSTITYCISWHIRL